MDFVPQVHMLVTEINPGDAGEASPLRVTGFMGGEAEFAVVPALYMVEFDVSRSAARLTLGCDAR